MELGDLEEARRTLDLLKADTIPPSDAHINNMEQELKVRQLAVEDYAAAITFVKNVEPSKCRDNLRNMIAEELCRHGLITEYLTAADEGLLDKSHCISMLREARLRRDHAMLRTIVAKADAWSLDTTELLRSAVQDCHELSLFPITATDSEGKRILIELAPTPAAREELAAGDMHRLVRGDLDDAVVLLGYITSSDRRRKALMLVIEGLARRGDADVARKLIADETEAACQAAGWQGLAMGLAWRGEFDESAKAAANIPSAENKSDWTRQRDWAVGQGHILHDDLKAGLQRFGKGRSSSNVRENLLREVLLELIATAKMDRVGPVIKAIGDNDTYFDLREQGYHWRLVAQACRDAGNAGGVRDALAKVDALYPRVPEKNRNEAQRTLLWLYAEQGESPEALKRAAAIEDVARRRKVYLSIARGCVVIGDIEHLKVAVAAVVPTANSHELNTLVFFMVKHGHVGTVSKWIASWPNAEDRIEGWKGAARGDRDRSLYLRTERVTSLPTD